MTALIIILSIYLLGVVLMFIPKYQYYNRVIQRKYKSSVWKYSLIDSVKWPVFIVFIIGVLFLIIVDEIKHRKQRKEIRNKILGNDKRTRI